MSVANLFLAQITFLNKTWYVANEAFSGENYYAPYITSTPELKLGKSKGGYVGLTMGMLGLSNNPYDNFHPFSIYTGGYKSLIENPNQLIPVKLYWGERETPLFDGSMSLDTLNSDNITFFLENEEYSAELLSLTRDVEAKLVTLTVQSLTKAVDNVVTVVSPDHGLLDGDLVVVVSSSNSAFNTKSEGKGSNITKVDESTFTYTAPNGGSAVATSTNHTVSSYVKRVGSFVFGLVNLKGPLIEIDNLDTDGKSVGPTFENPGLDPDDTTNRLELFDDGVLTGTTDTTGETTIGTGTLVKSSTVVTVTFSSAHNRSVGDQVKIEGDTSDSKETYNTRQIITAVPSSTTFEFIVGEYAKNPAGTHTVKTVANYYGDGRLPSLTRIRTRKEDSATLSMTYSQSGTTLTITFANHEFKVGDRIKVTFTSGGRNGTSETIDITTRNEGSNGKGTTFVATSATSTSTSGNCTTGTARGTSLVGVSAVSGSSVNGKTVTEFFEMIREKLSTADKPINSVDFSRAPNADTETYALFTNQQSLVIDYAGKIAENSNYNFTILNSILKVFDLNDEPSTFKEYRNDEIVDASYTMSYPIKAFSTTFDVNVPKTNKANTSLVQEKRTVRIENLFDGEVISLEPVTDDLEDAKSFLQNIKRHRIKPVTSITLGDLDVDVQVGDRIKTTREEDGLDIDMMVREITYNFNEVETTFVGDSTLSIIERKTVY